ncbi:putative metal-dependent hydrolase YabD [Bienertia sinuspersici]
MRLFDAHCHLQDPRIFTLAPQLIRSSLDSGIAHFAVNGVSEKDWHLVKQMSNSYPSVVPSFGVHPWFVLERTTEWYTILRQYFESTPSAAVGEIGIDKGSKGKLIDFDLQIDVFRKQLELAKELKRPASIHCVRAFGDLLEVMKSTGPFPEGVILHSYLGSAEMVPELARLGAYFSFSGFLMSMKLQKAKKMLKAVPSDRILLETDAPDGLPKSELSDLFLVEGDPSFPPELQALGENPHSRGCTEVSDVEKEKPELPKEMLNHPANIHNVLTYVASLLEMSKEEVAELSYSNAVRLFSYEGSKISEEVEAVKPIKLHVVLLT